MSWVYLIFAGLLEIMWAGCLKMSDGFTKFGWSATTVIGMTASFGLLSQAIKSLPLGTAYAIWTGIGALGALIIGVLFFKETLSAQKAFFAICLLVGIVGLKFSTSGS